MYIHRQMTKLTNITQNIQNSTNQLPHNQRPGSRRSLWIKGLLQPNQRWFWKGCVGEFLLFCLYQVWIKCCFDDNIVFMLQYTMYNEEHCQQFALHVTRQSCAQSACPHHTLMTRILHFLLCLTSSGYCNNYSNGRGSKMKNYMESIKGGKWGGCQGNTSKGLSHRGPLLTYFIM